MSEIQNGDYPQFIDALGLARRAFDKVKLREVRSDRAIRLFLASTALLLRDARRDPVRFNTECKAAGVKGGKKRVEVRAIRLAASDPTLHQPKWANCAAYLAAPPNGDPPPATLRAAERYIRRKGGIRALSDLHASHNKPQEIEPPDLTEWADAQLDGINAAFELDSFPVPDDLGDAIYMLALVRLDATSANIQCKMWKLNDEAAVRRAVTTIKRQGIVEDPKGWTENSIAAKLEKNAKKDEFIPFQKKSYGGHLWFVKKNQRNGPVYELPISFSKPKEEEAEAIADRLNKEPETSGLIIDAIIREIKGKNATDQPKVDSEIVELTIGDRLNKEQETRIDAIIREIKGKYTGDEPLTVNHLIGLFGEEHPHLYWEHFPFVVEMSQSLLIDPVAVAEWRRTREQKRQAAWTYAGVDDEPPDGDE